MDGFGARSAVDGFAKGLLLVQQIRNSEEENLDRQEARADRARRREREELTQLPANEVRDVARAQAESALLDPKVKEAQLDSAKATAELSRQKANVYRREEGKRKLREVYDTYNAGGGFNAGGMLDAMKDYGKDPRWLMSDEGRSTFNVLEEVGQGKRNYRDRQAIGGFNKLFEEEINKGVGTQGRDGGRITRKEIVDVREKDGMFGFKLKVYTDKSPDGYEADLTWGRGSGENDDVMLVSGEEIMNQIRGAEFFSQALNHPQVKPLIEAELAKRDATEGKYKYGGPGLAFNEATGEWGGPGMKPGFGQKASPSTDPRVLRLRADQIAASLWKTQNTLGYSGPKMTLQEIRAYAMESVQAEAAQQGGLSAMDDPTAGMSEDDVEEQLEALRKQQGDIGLGELEEASD